MANTSPHIKRTKAKGRIYYYFDTGQQDERGKTIWKRLPDPKDRSFGATYAALLGHRSKRQNLVQEMTVKRLVDLYQTSAQYGALKPATQQTYDIYLREFVDQLGKGPAEKIERRDVVLLLDQMADRPGAANMVLKSTRAVFAWARKRGHITNNPFLDIEQMDIGEHQPWPEEILQLALNAEDDFIRLAVHLLYYTAQRAGDVCGMMWRDIGTNGISVTQQKTGHSLMIPVHTALATELKKHPKTLGRVLIEGSVITAVPKLRYALQKFCGNLGYDVVPHGLRKNAVIALLEAGCSTAETAAISGQSLRLVEHYAKQRSQTKLGKAAILKWQRNKR